MIRALAALTCIVSLAMPPVVHAQTQVNPNQIARGAAITTPSVAAAVSFCGATPACEWHINSTVAVAGSASVPANVTLFFEGGGQIVVASGATLTVNGKVVAPPGVQLFAGAGVVAGIHIVDPRWYPASYTLAQIVALIPDAPDATVLPWFGTLDSGTEASAITRTNLTLLGQGKLAYNSGFTAFAPGASIVQGQLNLAIPNLTVSGVAFDLGSYQAAHGGWCAGDSSGNNAGGNLVDLMLPGGNKSNISVTHIATLGCNASTSGHSVLIEGFDGVLLDDIHTHFNTRGVVAKSSHTKVSNVDSQEHGAECLIFKADGTNGGVALTNLSATNVDCTDTGLVDIFGDDAALSNIKLVNVTMNGGGYLDLNGYTIVRGGSVDAVDITNFRESGAAGNAIQTVGGVGSVSITGGGVYGGLGSALFANSGLLVVTNFTVGYMSASSYGIYNNGANITVVGGHGINLANAYIHGVAGTTRYVGSTEDGNAGIVADGNAVLNVPIPYDTWGAGNLTAPYGAQNYFAKFTPSDSRFDHGVSATGWGTAQFVMYASSAAANQKRSMLYGDSAGVTHLALMDDALNSSTGVDAITITRSGASPSGIALGAPVTAPSIAPANGFTGTKTAGTCVFTITNGIITSVSGC